MKFSADFIERIQVVNNLGQIIGRYIQLQPTETGFIGNCPFESHEGLAPSLLVSEAKQIYHCTICQKSGNVFSFCIQYLKMSFTEAMVYLAGIANIPLPIPNVSENALGNSSNRKGNILLLNELAAYFFLKQFKILPIEHFVKKYLFDHGFSQEVIEQFDIGYSGPDWDGLYRYFNQAPLSFLEDARLIKEHHDRKGYSDFFRERLILPIFWSYTEPVGFVGLSLKRDRFEATYLRTPETLIFSKEEILYGLPQAAEHIQGQDLVIIVESCMDVLSLFSGGTRNVICTIATDLTLQHGKLLRNLTRNAILLIDGGDTAYESAMNSLPILLKSGMHAKALILPNQLSPSEYVMKFGVEALKNEISHSEDLFLLVLRHWISRKEVFSGANKEIVHRLRGLLESISEFDVRDFYLNEAARVLGVSPSGLAEAVGPLETK